LRENGLDGQRIFHDPEIQDEGVFVAGKVILSVFTILFASSSLSPTVLLPLNRRNPELSDSSGVNRIRIYAIKIAYQFHRQQVNTIHQVAGPTGRNYAVEQENKAQR
jgi:hypothetical protein